MNPHLLEAQEHGAATWTFLALAGNTTAKQKKSLKLFMSWIPPRKGWESGKYSASTFFFSAYICLKVPPFLRDLVKG
jgi:hypothetical protein